MERYPWLPQNLYDAFVESKRSGEAQLRADAFDYVAPGAMTVSAGDPMPYGFKANGHFLEALRQYSLEQGLTTRLVVRRRFDLVEGGAPALDLLDDLGGGSVPHEWLGIVIPIFDPLLDRCDKIRNAGEDTAA